MRAVVFAAGMGTRLRPLTDLIPKPLAPVGPWPLIRYALETVKAAGIREVGVNVFHLPEALPKALGDGTTLGLSLTWSREGPAILGTGGALRAMRSFLEGGPFAVLNGDTLVDFDLREALRVHRESGAVATMVLKDDPRVASYGAIGYDPREGRVWDLVGRAPVPAHAPPLSRALFTGVQVFSPEVFDFLTATGEIGLGTETYPALLKAGRRVSCLCQQGYWNDVGTAGRLFEANLDLITRRARFTSFDPLAGFAERAGGWVGDGAVIGPGTRLSHPFLVGAQASVDSRARVGPAAVIGRGATVENGVTVERALVLDRVTVSADVKGAIVGSTVRVPV